MSLTEKWSSDELQVSIITTLLPHSEPVVGNKNDPNQYLTAPNSVERHFKHHLDDSPKPKYILSKGSKNSMVLPPAHDLASSKTDNIAAVFEALKDDLGEIYFEYDRVILPVAEKQLYFGSDWNHWVTLVFDKSSNTATLIDSRPWYRAWLYNTKPLERMLRRFLGSDIHFERRYLSTQDKETRSGAWAVKVATTLALYPNFSVDEVISQIKSENISERKMVNDNLKQVQACSTDFQDKPIEESLWDKLVKRLKAFFGIAQSENTTHSPNALNDDGLVSFETWERNRLNSGLKTNTPMATTPLGTPSQATPSDSLSYNSVFLEDGEDDKSDDFGGFNLLGQLSVVGKRVDSGVEFDLDVDPIFTPADKCAVDQFLQRLIERTSIAPREDENLPLATLKLKNLVTSSKETIVDDSQSAYPEFYDDPGSPQLSEFEGGFFNLPREEQAFYQPSGLLYDDAEVLDEPAPLSEAFKQEIEILLGETPAPL